MNPSNFVTSLKLTALFVACAAISHAANGTMTLLNCRPTVFAAGASSSCTVYLSPAAPAGGAHIDLSTKAAGVTLPSSITIAAGASIGGFKVTTTASTPPQTAVITAIGSNTKTISLTITNGFQITSFGCTPTTLIPGFSANCTVGMSMPAPSGGWVATISDTSSQLSAPSTYTIPATASQFQFAVTASETASLLETVTISVTVQSLTRSTTVTINPAYKFSFQGTTSEITSILNGLTVVATTAPGNWPGVLSLIGSGKLAFTPVQGSSGVSFHIGGSQNTNTAFVHFSGTQAGQVFNPQGEVDVMLKSAYSFAQRKALASPNHRYAFMVNDDTRTQFALNMYTSNGRLIVGFTAGGLTSSYNVPVGQEDTLYGAGVVLNVKMTWTPTSATLYLNGKAVTTISFVRVFPNWTSRSVFTIGSAVGGYYAADDALAQLKVR
jgi:hypothetical protein